MITDERTAWRSRTTTWALVVLLVVMRIVSLTPNELSWDVFGYYLYLPATFIHHDPLLHDIGWIHEVMRTHEISGTLYQLSTAPDNSTPIYFFLMGMAWCYAPFFLVGHVVAAITGAPMDGFSPPYQISIAVGCVTYAFIGLVHVRRILLRFFGDGITTAVIAVIVLGTNYLHFATAKNLETANFLFCWMAVLVWNVLRWHEDRRRRNLLWTAFSIALIALIKPSEAVCGLIPVLWNVRDRASWKAKWALFRAHRKDVLRAIALATCVLAPQVLYWLVVTGRPIYDSYRNPGVGLDIFQPHILDVLFSFRKGWLLYTPVMVLALLGLFPLRRRYPGLFWAVAGYGAVSFYLIASWSEWWYGASYSVRPMITLYVLLSIPLGLSLTWIAARARVLRWGLGLVVVGLVALNVFQLWQFRRWIIHPYRTTKAYYLAVLGRTEVPPEAGAMLSVDRSFDGSDRMEDLSHYDMLTLTDLTFEDSAYYADRGVRDPLAGSRVLMLDGDHAFSPKCRRRFGSLTDGEYCWVKARVRVFLPEGYTGETPCLVTTMARLEGSYGYHTDCAVADSTTLGHWTTLETTYMTPPIRDTHDELEVYVWQRGRMPVRIDGLEVEAYIPH